LDRRLRVDPKTPALRGACFAHPCISAKDYSGGVPRGMAQPGWPPGLGRRSIGSLPTGASRAVA
jgi:hypothetical protein